MPYEKKNRANNGLEKHSQHVLFSLLLITVFAVINNQMARD